MVISFVISIQIIYFTFHKLKVTNYEQQALGSISIRIHSPPLDSFDDYYFGLNPYNNSSKLFYKTCDCVISASKMCFVFTGNPWFKEFWETKFNCKMLPTKPISTTTVIPTPQPIIDTSNSTDLPLIEVNYCTGKT